MLREGARGREHAGGSTPGFVCLEPAGAGRKEQRRPAALTWAGSTRRASTLAPGMTGPCCTSACAPTWRQRPRPRSACPPCAWCRRGTAGRCGSRLAIRRCRPTAAPFWMRAALALAWMTGSHPCRISTWTFICVFASVNCFTPFTRNSLSEAAERTSSTRGEPAGSRARRARTRTSSPGSSRPSRSTGTPSPCTATRHTGPWRAPADGARPCRARPPSRGPLPP